MKRISILLLSLICLLLACKKEVEPEPVTNQSGCLIIKSDQGSGNYSTFQYDENKRLTSIYQHIAASQTNQEENINTTIERDKNHRIIKLVSDRGNGFGALTTLEYDVKGRWVKTTFTNTPATDRNHSIVAEYNNEGLVAKTTTTTNSGSSSSTTVSSYEYIKGNVNKITYTNGNYVVKTQFEYYLDQQAKWTEVDQLYRYIGGSGSLSENVVKKVSVPAPSTYATNYTYQYNEKGFATLITAQSGSDGVYGNPVIITNTYTCDL